MKKKNITHIQKSYKTHTYKNKQKIHTYIYHIHNKHKCKINLCSFAHLHDCHKLVNFKFSCYAEKYILKNFIMLDFVFYVVFIFFL